MTYFEELVNECGVQVTTDKNGLYTSKTKAIALMLNDIILSDDESIRNAEWDEQKEMVKARFFAKFPYMKKN